jgi:hypothetical protein
VARLNFDSIFVKHPDNTIEPRQKIRVGGVTFGPGVRLSQGAAMGGVDFTLFVGRDFEVETDGDVFVIKGIYSKNGKQ